MCIIKVLAPGFYARKDMKTPVIITLVTLALGVIANFIWIDDVGIADPSVWRPPRQGSFWLNAIALYVDPRRRGHFRIEGWLATRLVRKQLLAALAMGVTIWLVGRNFSEALLRLDRPAPARHRRADRRRRNAVYFAASLDHGRHGPRRLLVLLRRKKVETDMVMPCA